MFKGNKEKVDRDANAIAERLRSETVTVGGLCREYSCSYQTMVDAIMTQMTKIEYKRLTKKRLIKAGIKTRFPKGIVPWNKGLSYQPGGRCQETQFKKGHLPATHQHKGTITIRKTKSGKQIRYIKIAGIVDGKHKWIPYASYVWQQASGTVPDGMFVVHIDGDLLNDDLSNLKVVDRAGHLANMRKNNPKVYKKIVRARTKTNRKHRKEKEKLEKLKLKQLQNAARETTAEACEKALVREQLEKLNSSGIEMRECVQCGYSPDDRNIKVCPKCRSTNFEVFKQKYIINSNIQEGRELCSDF